LSKPFDYSKYEVIPTTYNKIEYRSRLEARWALFFSSIDYEYRYEFKTFKGPDFPYTPDFWLKIDDKFLIIEIKPSGYVSTEEDRTKWRWMHDKLQENAATEGEFVVIYGMPYLGRSYGYWGKTRILNQITKKFAFNWWRQAMPEELAVTKWRNEYRKAAKHVFKDD